MEKEKKEIIDWIVKIVLIVIIIILLLHNCALSKKKNNEKKPTGNVDIIEIICDKDDTCNVDKKNDDNNNSNINTNTGVNNNTNDAEGETKPVSGNDGESTDLDEDIDDLLVRDKRIVWEEEVPAKIFTNSMYELEDIVAPEWSNTYQFVVKNGTEYNLKYTIDFVENNPYNINMKYKLKKNNVYLIDHYVSADDLNIDEMILNTKKNDTYYLEWKWISSDNDTDIGTTPDAKYNLKIEVKAESIND